MAIAAAASCALALTACGNDASDSDVADSDVDIDLSGMSVRIGTAQEQTLDMGTSYAVELLKSWGADVTREELTSLSGLEAVVAGQIDVAGRSADEVIEGQSKGVDIVAFAAPASVQHYTMLGGPDFTTMESLSGARIATSGPGGFDTMLITALLEDAGMSESDVTYVPIGGSGERTAALATGQADAAMVFMDNWLALESQGADVVLIGYVADMIPDLVSRTFSAEREFLDANEDLAVGIACANLEANAWINDDRDGFIELTTQRVTGSSAEDVGAFYDKAIELGIFPTEASEILSPEAFENTAEIMLEMGIIDTEIDADAAVDTQYLEQAAEMGCGQG
ncbi:ABC transporter substrate-binding protein [Ornithinimicrobium faecis]|uniref:ABC transporter substrate-binding protein n=1 Tax=Ornithinimicrobium faecis TaxID=2934158 RepID=UPI002117803B|nr:ABC transporter substrate-binding protein [Ornithinimicrobium sp. HY1745]